MSQLYDKNISKSLMNWLALSKEASLEHYKQFFTKQTINFNQNLFIPTSALRIEIHLSWMTCSYNNYDKYYGNRT